MTIQFWLNLMLLGNSEHTDSCTNHYGGNIWALLLHRCFMGFVMILAFACVAALFAFFMSLCFKALYEVVVMTKVMLTEVCKGVWEGLVMLQGVFTELWRAFIAFANVIHGALAEIWRNCTRDNVSSVIAIGIILYVFPEVTNRGLINTWLQRRVDNDECCNCNIM